MAGRPGVLVGRVGRGTFVVVGLGIGVAVDGVGVDAVGSVDGVGVGSVVGVGVGSTLNSSMARTGRSALSTAGVAKYLCNPPDNITLPNAPKDID